MKLYSKIMYHGSPSDFDKFDLSFMGSGQGAQGHGWGIYLAENKRIAKHYRDKYGTKGANIVTVNGVKCVNPQQVMKLIEGKYPPSYIEKMFYKSVSGIQIDSIENYTNMVKFRLNQKLDALDDLGDNIKSDILLMEVMELNNLLTICDQYNIQIVRRQEGKLYTVEIPDDLIFAEEKVLIQDSPYEVQNAVNDWREGMEDSTFREVHKLMVSEMGNEETTMYLQSYGVDGIKYYGNSDLDCVVIFDPDMITIKEKE